MDATELDAALDVLDTGLEFRDYLKELASDMKY
jgi:hypothetical protein